MSGISVKGVRALAKLPVGEYGLRCKACEGVAWLLLGAMWFEENSENWLERLLGGGTGVETTLEM